MPLFLIFVVVPLLELAVFAAVSEHIGIFTTLFLALLTAILGGGLVKHQGLQTLLSIRRRMDSGQMPLGEMFDGLCLVAAGALLITPGFVTDFIGFSLLVPAVRRYLREVIQNHTDWSIQAQGGGSDPHVIEGEYEHVDTPQQDHDNLPRA